MLIVQVNENKTGFDNLAGSATTGVPMGTWASFEGDYAPNIEWLRAGTSFNANTYPALAMYLGGTTVPERFDHNRLGDVEQVLPSASSFTAQYDGILIVNGYNNSTMNIQINGVAWSNMYTTNIPKNVQVPFNKGDVITFGSNRAPNVRYYKHPLFIKATPTSSSSDYEGNLMAIRKYQRDQNELSDYESITIGKSAANATTMQYDGFINIIANSTGTLYVYLNGETLIYYRLSGASYCDLPVMIAVKKGDVLYTNNVTTSASKARWYKKRDYSGR